MAELTKRNVLLECLQEQEEMKKLCSVKYEGRIPMKGMEKEFEKQEGMCRVLREIIQALENESVRKAMSDWQRDVMDNGPSAFKLDGGMEPELRL